MNFATEQKYSFIKIIIRAATATFVGTMFYLRAKQNSSR